MNTFVHLEVQSAYSFLWGTFTPDRLVQEVAAMGQKAVALTDFGLHGAVPFYKTAVKENIQPILGAKINIWDGSQITLLVINAEGYGNLCRLISIALNGGMSQQAFVTKQDLAHWSKGLICLAGGRNSKIRSSLEKNRPEAARFLTEELQGVIKDQERLFLMLQNHGQPGDNRPYEIIDKILDLAAALGIRAVAANEVTFLAPEDYILHRTLAGIQRRHHHREIFPVPNDRFYLTSAEEMELRIPYRGALENTRYIAEMCRSFSLPVGRLHPPSLLPKSEGARKLTLLSLKETARLLKPVTANYVCRVEQELKVINQMGLADFFLLVREVVDFARNKNIRHSVRGSAAGSFVVYLLLGGVDPVAHNLLFERFINEGRSDMPDIDLDFDSDRRDEVINYLMEKFPRQTAMVSTIHSFRVRSAVRLVARALNYPLNEISRLSSCLPWSIRGRDLNAALENLPELRDSPLHDETPLVNLAAKLTGLPFQCSVHLGGVIIAPGDIKSWTPVGTSPKGLPVGHLDKDDVDALGLLKLDLLGLRMHTAIRKAVEILQKKGISIDLDRMLLNDRKTYALLRSTESLGVFQLESPGQRNLLGRLQPRRFGDLIAEISLFRPGPVEGNMVEVYVERRNGEEPVTIPHPDLEPILTETYGVILFQEQVLRIVHVFAGLSYAEADAFRRAMTKDRRDGKMDNLKRRFVQGALEKGHNMAVIENVFRQVASFASYGFCKAHAASFAHITYQSSYLKAHHPQPFYLGLLNAGHVGSYPPSVILNEARRRGIPVYPPHINVGGTEYEPDGSGIRAPLWVVNGVGPAVAGRIRAERIRRGPFRSQSDFLTRISLPDRVVKILDTAGAFAGLDESQMELRQEVCSV